MTKIVFFGNERLATGVTTETPTLTTLIESGYEVCAIVSNFEQARSRKSRNLEVKQIAQSNKIPLLLPSKIRDIAEELKSYDAEIGILVAYGKIIPQDIIDIFPKGIVNVHPSLLPLHRGPTPIESTILNGDTATGVSIMKLVKEMDAGPVYGYSEIKLLGTEIKQDLANTLSELGASMIQTLLPGIIDGTVAAEPQDDSNATYDSLVSKEDGKIDFSKSAVTIEREIRAYANWPKSSANLAGIDVIITKASVSNISLKIGEVSVKDKQLIVGCGQGSLLIELIIPSGKKEMLGTAFIAGYKDRF